MSENTGNTLSDYLSSESMKEIDTWIKKYPSDQKQSAVMSALFIVQEEKGYLTPALMQAVADYLEMPFIAVCEVATFYTMYEREPVGENIIQICTNISCQLRDAEAIVHHCEKKLGITIGETTPDCRFTLRSVECLGACTDAPAMQLNKTYYGKLTCDKVDDILDSINE